MNNSFIIAMTSDHSFVRRLVLFPVLAALLTVSISSPALTISSGPSFTPAVNAPLAGVLALTTDVSSRVTVSVSDGTNTWERNFYDYRAAHSFPLLGFKPRRTNQITVTVHDRYGNEFTAPQPTVFITGPLPSDFPTIVLLESKPEKMEPGYTLFRGINNANNKGYLTIVDSVAEVVWYSGVTSIVDVRPLDNGDLLIPLRTSLVEINMLGQTVRTWTLPANLPFTHEAFPTDTGTILYLSDATQVVTNFPTSATDPNAPRQTANVWHNPVVEISATNAALLHAWSQIDILDPRRVSYLTFTSSSSYGVDWSHSNAIAEDKRDDSLLVSMRHQNAVIKFSRATGQLIWILGPHENWGPDFQPYLLAPVGTPFEWQYGQHTPKITPQGTVLLFDDGNYRASPFDPPLPDANNYSRAVEYDINEDTMEVRQVWEYGGNIPEPIYSVSRGDTCWLAERGNVLITFADVPYVNGVHPSSNAPNARIVRIKEVTHEPVAEVVFDFALFDYGNTNANYRGYSSYRADRIPDLYVTPAKPVADLRVTYDDGKPNLVFSADPARTYVVEASTDLMQWEEIGAAEHDGSGNFYFEDMQAGDFPARYYRVVTR